MPIVFVHGVANRAAAGYEETYASIARFLQRYVAPAISDTPEEVEIIDGYWGDLGATFAWDRASRPATPLLGMGPEDTPSEARLHALAELYEPLAVIPIATAPTPDTGGLISAGAGDRQTRLSDLSPDQLSDLAAAIVYSIADDNEDAEAAVFAADALVRDQAFLDQLTATDPALQHTFFVDRIRQKVQEDAELVGMGAGWWQLLTDRVGEVFDRGRDSTGWAASRALLEARKPLHNAASVFIGDVLEYIGEKTDDGTPGPIAERVLSKLREAKAISEQRNGEPIVVFTHSMGGQITYDIVSQFLPSASNGDQDIRIDLWAAAASQVGFFEELKLFHQSSNDYSASNGNKAPFPGSNLTAWWNVWDSNDILSFTAEPIFEGVDDEEYSSGMSVVGAHSGYYQRPSFFRKLAAKARAATGRN